nr:putative glycolipid-binding domain-containing protein [Gordonia araii]
MAEWHSADGASVERCHVVENVRDTRVTSVLAGGAVACSYTLHATSAWEFTSLVLVTDRRTLSVSRVGRTWLVDGLRRPDLAEAREVDISASPLTNTLPIRRLSLDIGRRADIITAYVDVHELTVAPDPQRYTRLDTHRYRYEARDSDFRRTITVDDAGLVVDYPGLFTRAPQR